MSDIKKLIAWNFVLAICLIGLAIAYHMQAARAGYFGSVPVNEVHTMRVWEDGSFEIVYQDNTSEVGCLPEGNCND